LARDDVILVDEVVEARAVDDWVIRNIAGVTSSFAMLVGENRESFI
jgi:hypothetical protein